MRIGINTRLLIAGKMDGIGWFTCESLRLMVKAHPEHEFYFFFDRKPAKEFLFATNVHPVVLNPPARHPILWYLFFEWSLRFALKRHHIDLFLSTDGYIPLRGSIPIVDVIHDLNFEHAQGNLKPSHQWYMTHFFPRFARRADRIATVSEYSKQDIATTYRIDSKKIDVVYNGSHSHYHPYPASEQQSIRDQFTDGKPYFVFISTILKRKNLANLLKAFDIIRNQHDVKLVVIGSRIWWQDELKQAYDTMLHANDVVFLGHIDSEQLSCILSGAIALTYPSYFEGFGIPIIEAFYAETPVITSNTTSMPEVAGDAALLIDPHDPKTIADAMCKLLDSEDLCKELIQRGRRQREQFSWERTSTLLWDCMMRALQ